MKKSEEYNDDYKKLGWKKLDDVSQYIDKAGDVTVYQNEKKKGTIIFVGRQKNYAGYAYGGELFSPSGSLVL